ncbi:hypothetical protein ID866_5111 [Astraeus odoratus]|nr:hypothetical protein ID866_5111 [Astraeus odoratus]
MSASRLSSHRHPASIPPLIDLDASSSSSSSSSAHRPPSTIAQPRPTRPTSYKPHRRLIAGTNNSPRHHLDESDIDRFATLFSPATPPATPIQVGCSEQSKPIPRPPQHRRTYTDSSSSDSDFGPFVSVPPNQDPLAPSASLAQAEMANAESKTRNSAGLSASSEMETATKTGNASLDYFGHFTTSAKAASERSRKGVLDELLEHQDDPMYFLSTQAQDEQSSSSHVPTVLTLLDEEAELRVETLSPQPSSTLSSRTASGVTTPTLPSLLPVPSQATMQPPPRHAITLPVSQYESIADALASELDISKHHPAGSYSHVLHTQTSSCTHTRPSSRHALHAQTATHEHTYPFDSSSTPAPLRKKSLSSLTGVLRTGTPLPPRLSESASPPSASSPSASAVSLPLPMSVGQGRVQDKDKEQGHQLTSPPAHATLSRLSSGLVSAFLSGTSKHSRSGTSSSTTFSTATMSSSLPTSSSTFRHFPSDYSGISATGPTITHRSPFASTPFIPPSGAPGFTGDRNWDKGFSDALLLERDQGVVDPIGLGPEVEHGEGEGVDGSEMGNASRSDSLGIGRDGSEQKRNGSLGHGAGVGGKSRAKWVKLAGRRAGTAEILTDELANLIRPHLPALTRLPRTWTLLYSLDQHGISLNTLYARCEPRIPCAAEPNPPKGALVVAKDSLDGIFGAWLGEGIMKGQGGYYGSGEA